MPFNNSLIAILPEDSILKILNINIPRLKAINILIVKVLFPRTTRRNILATKLLKSTKNNLF